MVLGMGLKEVLSTNSDINKRKKGCLNVLLVQFPFELEYLSSNPVRPVSIYFFYEQKPLKEPRRKDILPFRTWFDNLSHH